MRKKIAVIALLLFVLFGSTIHFSSVSVKAGPGCTPVNGNPPPVWCEQ